MDDDLTDTVIRARPPRPDLPPTSSSGPIESEFEENTLIAVGPRRREAAAPGPATAPGLATAPARASRGRHAPADTISGIDASTRHPYRFSINGDAPLSTATATIVGRDPRAPRLPHRESPRLVAVVSPLKEVSASHLEVRQQGASVVVTDLRSTNGTVVVTPGRDPVRLRPGESHVVVPGSLIDIGDGNVLEILATDRVVPTGTHGPGGELP